MNAVQRAIKRFKRAHRTKEVADISPGDFLFKNGNPMAILRPAVADVAPKIRAFEKIPAGLPAEPYQAYCNEILDRFPHRFIGYALKDGRIVNCAGKPIDHVEPGDSFVNPSNALQLPDFMVTGRMHDEIWDGRRVLVLPRPDLKADSNTGIVLESPDPTEKASIVLRGGATEIDCHIPSLNHIWTGDRNVDWRTKGSAASTEPNPQPTAPAESSTVTESGSSTKKEGQI